MQKLPTGSLRYSPSDLIRFMASPYASWLDRFHLEHPGQLTPDPVTEDQQLIFDSGVAHEASVLKELRATGMTLIEIPDSTFADALAATTEALNARPDMIFQAALELNQFAGHADFLKCDPRTGEFSLWDAKLARSTKPYYLVQLCAYAEMLTGITGKMPRTVGIFLGSGERAEFRTDDFYHYYLTLKRAFLDLQDSFTGKLEDAPEPAARADHGRWTSHAEQYFQERDHLVRVAGITVGQIKKLNGAGISTMTQLSAAAQQPVPKLNPDSLAKLAAQARLQLETLKARQADPEAPPSYELIETEPAKGLAAIPTPHEADVFFDIEGYPLVPGGLEYLLGVWFLDEHTGERRFRDWWAHDRAQEKRALEGFIDWVYARWRANPGMHIYHYAPYEVSAIRRLSTQHDTRQDEVDDLLRGEVFVDLYRTVRHGLRVGEDSYSIKKLESLYWRKRGADVDTAVDSIVQYANWLASGEPADPESSRILRGIRDYNEEDVRSTEALRDWLLELAEEHGITRQQPTEPELEAEQRESNPIFQERAELATQLRELGETVLGDVLDFHRREDKPKWWRVFDLQEASPEELRDDPACLEGLTRSGSAETIKQSTVQWYRFDANQECKLAADSRVNVVGRLMPELTVHDLDLRGGRIALKLGNQNLTRHFDGQFPEDISVYEKGIISSRVLQDSLLELARARVAGDPLPQAVTALLNREAPAGPLQLDGETELDAAIRVTSAMDGGCLVIQGPPGTGKTYAASRAICALVAHGKRVGITSNSHKAAGNLLSACAEAAAETGNELQGLKIGGARDEELHRRFPGVEYSSDSGSALDRFRGGVIAGTAWLFSRPEWKGQLDFLFVDEAGQVALANALAYAGSARNLVLLGDQMQLEQPVQGAHPGDAGMSVLQYMLKDDDRSRPDAPVLHAVVPPDAGLFLGTSRRMHPDVCSFISESIYESRLASHESCAGQSIDLDGSRGTGVLFEPVEHDGNIQSSEEEADRIARILNRLLGRPYTDRTGVRRPLELKDFVFIAPYNAQVRTLTGKLPPGARVGSVDRFQGQEAPVCILSMCSSFGEYGSRGLKFILDQNRINVAISRAMCLAVVVGDPRIAGTAVNSVDEMRLVNLYCRIRALGEPRI